MTTRIDRLWPDPAEHLSDEDLVARTDEPILRVNFVSSVDGAATHDGRSGGLSGTADKRVFELLRRTCDVVLVGAGTVRIEGYAGLRVSDASAAWRQERGLTPHPVFAIVSGRLDLEPASPVFTDAPVRPIVFTTPGDRAKSRSAESFADVADVITADAAHIPAALHERGLTRILCEGGPHLFGSLLTADVVDELHLTIAPRLEGGGGPRITAGDPSSRALELTRVLRSGDELLLRYARSPVRG